MELEKIEHSENAIFQRYYLEANMLFLVDYIGSIFSKQKDEIIIKENFNIAMIYSDSCSSPNQYEKTAHTPKGVCCLVQVVGHKGLKTLYLSHFLIFSGATVVQRRRFYAFLSSLCSSIDDMLKPISCKYLLAIFILSFLKLSNASQYVFIVIVISV